MKKIFDSEYLNIGSGISPFNAWLLLRGLRTLPVRLERISRTTGQVLQFLKTHPKIGGVIFPFDEGFGQRELAKAQMSGACGLITFWLKESNVANITTVCNSLQHILMAVSWGGYESLIIPKCAGMPEAAFDPAIPEHSWIRLYMGLEDADYIIADLTQALIKI